MRRSSDYARGLATWRRARGLTRTAEARISGVSVVTWWRWETCRTRPPEALLEAVSSRWGCSVDDLVREPEEGPDAAVRALVVRHGAGGVRAALGRVSGAVAADRHR